LFSQAKHVGYKGDSGKEVVQFREVSLNNKPRIKLTQKKCQRIL